MKNYNIFLAALLLCLFNFGCSLTPKRVKVSPVARAIPVDKVYYIPWALGSGLVNTLVFSTESFVEQKPYAIFYHALAVPLNLSQGLLFTTFDTVTNIICWIPLEIYEITTNKTWETPFMGHYSYPVKVPGVGSIGGGWQYQENN
ncbi:MAG: hypothetical protein GXO84_07605 [Chlorobi bacterium]|nr:hypothetical protein [Chlorobiota bacterium]